MTDLSGECVSIVAEEVRSLHWEEPGTISADWESRIASITRSGVTTNTFAYNGLDTRISMVDSGGTKTFKREGAYVTDLVLFEGAAVSKSELKCA